MNFTPTGKWTYNYSDYDIWDNELLLTREEVIEYGKGAYDDSFYIGEVELGEPNCRRPRTNTI